MNKVIIAVLVAIVIIAGAVYLFGNRDGQNKENEGPIGSLVISVTDAAANMENVSEVRLSISDIQMRTETGDYVTVSTDDKEYSLLELDASGQAVLYANAEIPAGTYSQARIAMDSVTVVTADGTVHEAVMVDDNFEVETTIIVEENATSTVELDFLADQSLYTTSDGSYVFAPVVKVTSQTGAEVNVEESTGVVTVLNGQVTASATVGMNLDGKTEANFRLGENSELEVLEDGTVQIVGGTNATGSAQVDATSELENQIEATLDKTLEKASNTSNAVDETLETGAEAGASVEAEARGALY